MTLYHQLLQNIADTFDHIQLQHTPRIENNRVDALATLAASIPTEEVKIIHVYVQDIPAIHLK